ncbi:MAG: PIN/TRAM domain-containing protein [Planctomycetes bacterium]|nr:PIN/TRAM domain-containing protein [Planctomycetota bacterium]
MTLRLLLRILFITFVAAFAFQVYCTLNPESTDPNYLGYPPQAPIYSAIAAVIAFGIVFFEARFQRNLAREIVAIAFGLVTGIVVTSFVIALLIVFILPRQFTFADSFIAIRDWIPLITITICYVAVTIVLQTKGDFRFLVPYIDFSHRGQDEGGFILDTSVIIDGRISDISTTNIIARPFILPDFVIYELQTIADSPDRLKRKRGRRGLDILNALQKSESVRVQILETDIPNNCDVDHELVMLAKRLNGRVITNDFNLNKIAQLEDVRVINLNDLANALKPVVLPGEEMPLRIIRPGDEMGQGVGYLDDGTMVVVEQGRNHINEDITVVVTGTIQTSAGRMVFGKLKDDENGDNNQNRSNSSASRKTAGERTAQRS